MRTCSEKQLEGIIERLKNHLLKDHVEGDRTSMYSKFSTVVHHMEMLRVALDYYKKEDQESTNRVLELEKDSIRWTYAGFYPEASGWYYTKDLNGIVMDRHFDTVKGWTPNDSFDTWAHIPEIHVL